MKKLLVLLLLLSSCSQEKTYLYFDPYQQQDRIIQQEKRLMSLNSVKEKIQIEIGLDTAGRSLFSRITDIRTYNKDGLIISSIKPQYRKKEFTFPKDQPGIDVLKFLSSQMNETDIPTGINNTTYYSYNKDGHLQKEENWEYDLTIIINFKYDKLGNMTERIVMVSEGQNFYEYMDYKYNKNKRIIYRKDSTSEMGMVDGRYYASKVKLSYYKYDEKGRIIYDGKYNRIFNDANQLFEISYYSGDDYLNKVKFTYDKKGNCICITKTSGPKNYFPKTHNSKTFYYYNDKNLLIQEKTIYSDNSLSGLYNYEYTYY